MSDLHDFYPTPGTLIEKMLEGLNLEAISTVLEPSAGKGDICDVIMERTKYRSRKLQIDVIEIDPNLQHILRGKGYNLIHDDFLTLKTYKQYQLIVANFPFSEGIEHLQKALSLLEASGGMLVCLVNAETIRNQYTKLRQAVATRLDDLGATIEYLEDAFTDAERHTSVEVALIRVQVERKAPDSVLLETLKKAEHYEPVEHEQTDVVETDFIKAMVKRFDLEARAGIRLIEEYQALRPMMLDRMPKTEEEKRYSQPILKLEVGNASEYSGDYINEYLRALRYKYWGALLNDDRFRRLYTSNILQEISRKLEILKDCDFSGFNIQQLTAELNRNVISGVERAILDMFDEFSIKYSYRDEFGGNIHYYNGWKTNQAYKINKKVIVPMNGFSSYSWGEHYFRSYHVSERIADLVKAFNYLAGELDGANDLVAHALDGAERSKQFRNVDFYYFTATFFKKGTCHIVFKDQRLLDKLNIYGSQRKGWLPPSYGKRNYTEMTEEERQVIDAFQGEEAYNQIVANSDYYLAEPGQLLLAA